MKASLLILFCFLAVQTGYCQLSYGGKAGINISNVKFDEKNNPVNLSERLGIHLGIFAEKHFSKKLLLRSEIVYSVKGFLFDASTGARKGIESLHYINVPLLFGYKAWQDVTVYAGPEFGYLTLTSSGKAGYEDYDMGVSGGILYKISPLLQLDARYTYGLPILVKYKATDYIGAPSEEHRDGSNRTFQLGINYFLHKSE